MLKHLGVAAAVVGVRPLLPAASAAGIGTDVGSDRLEGLPVRGRFGVASSQGGEESEQVETPIAFSMIGFALGDRPEITFRTSADGRTWSDWTTVGRIPEGEGPEPGAPEDNPEWRAMSVPTWVGEARSVQVRGRDLARLRVELIDSAGLSRSVLGRARAGLGGLVAAASSASVAEAAPRPSITTRSQWGANESWRSGSPRYASSAHFSVIHHTVTGHGASPGDVPAIIRGIYHYHTQSLGWADIGYNFLIDRWGRVFEGRYGGVDRAVIGAHAANYNTGSIGVAAIGCFHPSCGTRTPLWRDMLDGFDGLLAWKFSLHGIDPQGTTTTNSRRIPTIVGHRDVGSTACPGDYLYNYVRGVERMGDRVAVRMGSRFRDVPADSTFAADIEWIAAAGITRGCNPPTNDLYCPKHVVTREQMASFLARGLGLTNDSHPGFVDVPAGSTHDRDIRRIARADITRGCNPPANDRFCPKDAVSREQMAAFLVRGLGLTDDNHPGFDDVPAGSRFDRDIRRLARAGITRGCNPPDNTRFCPRDPVTREQMAAFLRRGLS